MNVISIRVGNVKVGDRTRKDLGSLDDLAESMQTIGLLHPIILNSKNELIAGLRRLKAAEQLEWSHINAIVSPTLDELVKALQAEDDENTCRKAFTSREAVAMGRKIEAAVKPAADAAKEASKAKPGEKVGNGRAQRGDKLSPRTNPGKTRKAAAAAAGMSEGSYSKAKEVDESGEEDIAEEMDATGNVSAAHKKLKERQAENAEDPLAATARLYVSEINLFVRRLDELIRNAKELEGHSLARAVHWHSIIDQLKAARGAADIGRPKFKCPYCKATGRKDNRECRACHGQGWVHKTTYKSGCAAVGVPDESGEADE